jgi:FAD:protein FMN transferase
MLFINAPSPDPPAFQIPQPFIDRETLSMGTRLRLQLEGSSDLAAASEAAIVESDRIEQACSTWRADSAWSRLNEAGEGVLDTEWISLLREAKAWSKRLEGAFDPVLGRLIAVWGTRLGGRLPSDEELKAARNAAGVSHLTLGPGSSIHLSDGAWLEEGGFVKGYALDRMKDKLVAAGVRSGCLDFGGQLLVWGKPRMVSVADPLDRTRSRFLLLLKEGSLACSSDSERGRHIMDPQTGHPCEPWGEVAVVAPSGLEADILSKLFVLGPDRGLTWADAHGVAAAFLPNGKAPRFSRVFLLLNPTQIQELP